jgi:hypothetical protein
LASFGWIIDATVQSGQKKVIRTPASLKSLLIGAALFSIRPNRLTVQHHRVSHAFPPVRQHQSKGRDGHFTLLNGWIASFAGVGRAWSRIMETSCRCSRPRCPNDRYVHCSRSSAHRLHRSQQEAVHGPVARRTDLQDSCGGRYQRIAESKRRLGVAILRQQA